MGTTKECTFEIKSNFTEEEIKDFDKVKALEYLIEFLGFKRQCWQKKYALKKPKQMFLLLIILVMVTKRI